MILDHVIKLLRWCEEKVILSEHPAKILFKEGEIWWRKIGMNLGAEIYGKGYGFIRPILIFKKFAGSMFLGIPLTSKRNQGSWYVPLSYGGKEGQIILNQLRSMDNIRLVKRIGTLEVDEFERSQVVFCDFYCPQEDSYPVLTDGASGNPKDDLILPKA